MCYIVFFFFFFSSRRRHTRCSRDWSSDVCSSDLHVLDVYQTLNARPPGVGASIGFGALHAGSFVVALVAVAMFTLGPTGRFPRFGRFGGPPALKHTLPSDDGRLAIRRASTAPAPDPAAPYATLVATFDKPPE